MRRLPILLLLLAVPLLAQEGRDAYLAAREELKSAYFDELDADKRDRLFEALGAYDDREVIPTFADVASLYGTYLNGLESRMASEHAALEPYADRTALTDQEIGFRNDHIHKLERLEKEWVRALASEDLLAKVLGAFKDPKTVQAAFTYMQRHPTGRVRQMMARACGYWHKGLGDERTSRKMLSMLRTMAGDEDYGVRVGVARAAASFQRQEGIELLKTCLKDDDWRVRAAAVKGLHQAGTNEAVDLLIGAMQKEEGRLREDIAKALKELTGETHAFPEEWARWWKSVGKELPPPKPPASETAEEEEEGDPDKVKRLDEARFYGIRTTSDRICFVIDVSGSMQKEVPPIRRVVITGRKDRRMPAEGKTRIEVARNELKRSIYELSSKKEFLIIYFNHAVRKWRPEMEKATPEVKKQAMADVEAMTASGTTYTLGALREAFSVAGVINRQGTTPRGGAGIDTIFLLSDGGPTDNKIEDPQPMDPDLILDQVRQWNRDAGVVIHTIAVDCDENGTYFLKQLAAQNGGVFVERKQ